jgi:hypothetical protein
MLRRITLIALLLLIAAGAYAVPPFVSVWQIREAARAGDVATLERKVDWVSVRRALKQSGSETRAAMVEFSEAAGIPKPGLWQRLKSAAAPFLADPLIDRYVTAEGAPQIYAWRQAWRQKVRPGLGLQEPPSALSGTKLADTGLDRVLTLARRVERAAFAAPMRVEIDVRDRYREDRRWRAVLELQDWSWKLTEVHVLHGPRRPAPKVARN